MRLHPIESEALEAVGYDSGHRLLQVRFVGGGIYEYSDVDRDIYERLMAAQPHPWRELHDEVRRHAFVRVD